MEFLALYMRAHKRKRALWLFLVDRFEKMFFGDLNLEISVISEYGELIYFLL